MKTKPGSPERAAIAEVVLQGMNGGLSCFKACQAAGVPHNTFLRWVDDDPELADRYAGARHNLIERMANELLDISDAPVPTTDSGATDSGAVQDKRLRVDTRKWLLSKLAPKKYGDKIETTHQVGESITKIVREIVK